MQGRLKKYLKAKSLTYKDFENICGLSNGTAARLRPTTRESTFDRIANSCDLNIKWLLSGEGSMIDSEKAIEPQVENKQYVPLIHASAFAGNVKGFAPDSISLERCDKIISPLPGVEMAIPITGDSMEPDYPDGAIAYIKRINEKAFIPWGHTVVLDTENGAFIKRIYPDNEDLEYIWAKSINPNYPPIHIPVDSIYRIFRVLGTSKFFTTM